MIPCSTGLPAYSDSAGFSAMNREIFTPGDWGVPGTGGEGVPGDWGGPRCWGEGFPGDWGPGDYALKLI